MTPDPAGLAAVDPGNPQSWNRYAYVMNNPMNLIDPIGMAPRVRCGVARDEEYICIPLPDTGGSLGTSGDEFDLLKVPVYGLTWIPFPLNQPGPNISFQGGFATTQLTDGYYLGWGLVGNGLVFSDPGNSGGNGSGAWIRNFAKSFIKFSGGPRGKQLCVVEFLKAAGSQLNPFSPSGATTAELGTRAAGAAAVARPWIYAALRTNTHGGTGLICPWCSSTFRNFVGEYYTYAADANAAAPVAGLVVAEAFALFQEYNLAKEGICE